jgi:23S rRNA pseudouridine1911/1915/1917 synthase
LIKTFAADRGLKPTRLDIFLTAWLAPELSRSQVTRIIRAGLVSVNGSRARSSQTVRAGDRIEVAEPNRAQTRPDAVVTPDVPVIYADSEIVLVNKPPGLTVHSAPGHRGATLVDFLTNRFPEMAAMVDLDGISRPGIVHRLDKDTSGVMVVARTPFARTALSRQFKDRTVHKTYLAIVRGTVSRDRLTISRPIGRHPVERKRMSVRTRTPRDAVTKVEVVARLSYPTVEGPLPMSLLKVEPLTGRTHQIRVHLASIGHSCVGDRLYGKNNDTAIPLGRQALHAFSLSIEHPRTGKRLNFSAQVPDDLAELLRISGFDLASLTAGGN